MAYQTGTASNPNQLLDALRQFAVANGWTQLRWAPDGAGQTLSLSKGGLYANLRSATNERLSSRYGYITGIWLMGSTGFDAGKAWWDQPGTIVNANYSGYTDSRRADACGLFNVSASNTYHLFAASSPDMILLVAEVSTGVYHHLAFGELAKYGAYSGGAFVTGSFRSDAYIETSTSDYIFGTGGDRHGGLPFNDYKSSGPSFVRAAVDATNTWFSICSSTPLTGKRGMSIWNDGTGTPMNSLAYRWWESAPNTLNGVTPMIPFLIFVERTGGMFSPFGYTPHLRYLDITNYSPCEQFSIGPDQWMAFPAHSKNNKSGVHGFAVRVNG